MTKRTADAQGGQGHQACETRPVRISVFSVLRRSRSRVTPHPGPLPKGEGEAFGCPGKQLCARPDRASALDLVRRRWLPLPAGEGRGEGNQANLRERVVEKSEMRPPAPGRSHIHGTRGKPYSTTSVAQTSRKTWPTPSSECRERRGPRFHRRHEHFSRVQGISMVQR